MRPMGDGPAGASAFGRLAASPWAAAWLAALVTFVAQLWVLELPLQLDAYPLLEDPRALFAIGYHGNADPESVFALRWTAWALYALVFGALGDRPAPLVQGLGLALHALSAGLLALAVARAAGGARGRLLGLVSGVLFGAWVGGLQALTWTSAWCDLLVLTFALAAFERFAAARRAGPARRLRLRLAGAFLLTLALFSKESLLPIAPALWLALWAVPDPRRALAGSVSSDPSGDESLPSAHRRRFTARPFVAEALAVAGALAVHALGRWLYLGSLRPAYSEIFPTARELALAPFGGLGMLGQAFLPHNAHPLVADLGAGGAAGVLLGHLPAQTLGLGLWLVCLAAGALAGGWTLALRIAALAAAAFVLAAPSGLLVPDPMHNGLGRLLYPALAPGLLAALLALVCLAEGVRARFGARAAALASALAALVAFAVLWPLRAEYQRIERAAAEERSAWTDAARLERLYLSQAQHPVRLLAIDVPAAFAGLPQLDTLLPLAVQPPFWHGPGPPLEGFAAWDELGRALAGPRPPGEIAHLLLPSHGMGGEDPSAAPSARRAGRLPALLRLGPVAEPPELRAPDEIGRIAFDPPLSPYGLVGFELRLEGAGPFELRLEDERGEVLARVRGVLSAEGPGRIAVAAPADAGFRLGPKVAALGFEAGAARALAIGGLAELPEVLWRPTPSADLVLDPELPPLLVVTLPPGWAPPTHARLELIFANRPRPVVAVADLVLPPGLVPGDSIEFRAELLHGDGSGSPLAPAGPIAPWDQVLEHVALPILTHRGHAGGAVDWRLSLIHPDGTPAALGQPLRGRFRLPGDGRP